MRRVPLIEKLKVISWRALFGGVPVFPGTGKLSRDTRDTVFQRFQPVLGTLDFAIGAIRKWQSLKHGPEDVQRTVSRWNLWSKSMRPSAPRKSGHAGSEMAEVRRKPASSCDA
jgi:hypothetical protein